jgi:hypothetical protein
MKKSIFTLLLFALAFACQREANQPEPEQKNMYYYMYSEKAQGATNRTCIYKRKRYTYIAGDAHQVAEYRRMFSDAVIQDSLFATGVVVMNGTICGQTFNMEDNER